MACELEVTEALKYASSSDAIFTNDTEKAAVEVNKGQGVLKKAIANIIPNRVGLSGSKGCTEFSIFLPKIIAILCVK